MNKINNKIIVFIFALMAVLVFGLITAPTETKAQAYGGNLYFPGSSNYPQTYYQPPTQIYYYVEPQAPVYVPTSAPTPIVYSSTTNPNAPKIAPKAVARAKTMETSKVPTVASKPSNDSSNLAANAFWGSNSFMPSGIIQWILFAILVLVAVILGRKIYGGKEKYHATPMKHS